MRQIITKIGERNLTEAITIRHTVLLAAGRGTRLGALTADRPKPMVLLNGKPVLEHILCKLQRLGITHGVIVIGYRGDVIRDHFGDGAPWGMQLTYAEQPVPDGTGSALHCACDLVGDEPILASFADILTDDDHYRRLIADYTASPCAAVVGINPVEDTSAGSAVYREGDRVVRVVEKPPRGTSQSHWNLAGVSVYSPAIWPVLATLQRSARGEYELTDAIQTLITLGNEVRAIEFNGFWSDIGTPEALHAAEFVLQQENVPSS